MIPKIIHQTWKTEEVPEHLSLDFLSWRTHQPDWQIWGWTDASLAEFVRTEYPALFELYSKYLHQIERVNIGAYHTANAEHPKIKNPANSLLLEATQEVQNTMSKKDLCLVLASDSSFFGQLQLCIASIRRWPLPYSFDIKVIAVGLSKQQLQWLEENGICAVTDLSGFPRFPDGPDHLVAMTCRPYIPESFPGYRAYLWVDCDIRFLLPEGLLFYAEHALNPEYSIVISHETEPTYNFNADPQLCALHHSNNFKRISEEFGTAIGEYFQYYNIHNAGVFGARADSPIWARYKRNLETSMRLGQHWAREQDAMNVSLIEVGDVKEAPTTHNWLCGFSIPIRDLASGAWVSPREPGRKIAVAHLTNSSSIFNFQDRQCTLYEYYQTIGLTE